MKRREKNVLLRQLGDSLDIILIANPDALSIQQKASLVGMLKELDEGMHLDHSKRGYHKLIQEKKLVLEQEVG